MSKLNKERQRIAGFDIEIWDLIGHLVLEIEIYFRSPLYPDRLEDSGVNHCNQSARVQILFFTFTTISAGVVCALMM